jgi:hypothetical protein
MLGSGREGEEKMRLCMRMHADIEQMTESQRDSERKRDER